MRVKVAVLGSGNIGTDLMIKVLRRSAALEMAALIGIDPRSDGLARAKRLGVEAVDGGLEGFAGTTGFQDVQIFFDATSAKAHAKHAALLEQHDKIAIDLTPAAVGPYVVPVVNLEENLRAPNVSMVSCGGQATIPMVAAVGQVAKVHYAEIVASIASLSAGPGTRANIDEFTHTTAVAVERVGGAGRGKAIIILNPADPPLMMRDTVFCLSEEADTEAIRDSVTEMVARVQEYVPGYRLKQDVQFDAVGPLQIPGQGAVSGLKTTVFLEVEGAGHYLPKYAGNLDIMTSAALATGEKLVELRGLG